MTNWEHMAALVGRIPDLPGARCKGKADLYEATVAEQRIPPSGKPESRAELENARTAALRICAGCPSREPCRAWLVTLPPIRRPRGVIAGQVITSTGLPLMPRTMAVRDAGGVLPSLGQRGSCDSRDEAGG